MPAAEILRELTAADLGQVSRLLNGIFRTAGGHDQNVITDFPLVFTADNFRNCRVITIADRVVAHAAVFPCELAIEDRLYKTGIIVLVATEAAHRRRGYAARLMRDLQRTMAAEEYDLGALWTGVPRFYEPLGWERTVTRGLLAADLPAGFSQLRAAGRPGSVLPYAESAHLDGIMRIHESEPVRVLRSRSEYADLLTLPKIFSWVLVRDRTVAAYVVIGQAINKSGVIEYGGASEDIFYLTLRVIGENSFPPPLQMLFFEPHGDLAERFRGAGIGLEPLESSKGRGIEMLWTSGDREFPPRDRERIFFWGLDAT